jgi:hypothetical protein
LLPHSPAAGFTALPGDAQQALIHVRVAKRYGKGIGGILLRLAREAQKHLHHMLHLSFFGAA